MKQTRKFNGKTFHLAGAVKSKKAVKDYRERAQYGYVRSTPVKEDGKTVYAIWVRSKRTRKSKRSKK